MSKVIISLTGLTFGVAAGLFCIGFLLLAAHWLARPVQRVLALCGSIRHLSIRDLANGIWWVAIPIIQLRQSAVNHSPSRINRKLGLAGAILIGISGTLFFLGAMLGFLT